MPVALVTGASKGLGRALARSLGEAGWTLVIDARNAAELNSTAVALRTVELRAAELETPAGHGTVYAVAGDVADAAHRAELEGVVARLGHLDLLVNNASTLGPSPLPALSRLPLDDLEQLFRVNVVAPLALTQQFLPWLRASGGTVLDISSDAAVEAYPGWGGYGATKAALDHLGRVLAEEEPTVRVYSVDPGDMRTDMHRAAFPGEDISDRPEPESVAPAILRLLDADRPPSGRYTAAELSAAGTAGVVVDPSVGSPNGASAGPAEDLAVIR